MFIHARVPKSKQRKLPKAQQAQYDAWLKSIEAMKPKSLRPMTVAKSPVVTGVFVRETQKIKSLDTGLMAATKPAPKVYTGSAMKVSQPCIKAMRCQFSLTNKQKTFQT